MIYKHVNGSWSVIKERDIDSISDAILSPFTVEVWIREVNMCEKIENLLKSIDVKLMIKCEEPEEIDENLCRGLYEEHEKLVKDLIKCEEETKLNVKDLSIKIINAKSEDELKNMLEKHGFRRVK